MTVNQDWENQRGCLVSIRSAMKAVQWMPTQLAMVNNPIQGHDIITARTCSKLVAKRSAGHRRLHDSLQKWLHMTQHGSCFCYTFSQIELTNILIWEWNALFLLALEERALSQKCYVNVLWHSKYFSLSTSNPFRCKKLGIISHTFPLVTSIRVNVRSFDENGARAMQVHPSLLVYIYIIYTDPNQQL